MSDNRAESRKARRDSKIINSKRKKKKEKKHSLGLSRKDIDFLHANTRYDEQEIKEWYR